MSWKRFMNLETSEIIINSTPLTVTDGELFVNNNVIGNNTSLPFIIGALQVHSDKIITPEVYTNNDLNIVSGGGNIILNPDSYTIINNPDFNGYELKNIADANSSNSAVTKSYVDGVVSGLSGPTKLNVIISNSELLNLHITHKTLITAVSGKVFNIQYIRFFTYTDLSGSGTISFYNGSTPMNWTAPATIVTCSSQDNISYVHPTSYSTTFSSDFNITTSSAFTGSGTTYITIYYTVSDISQIYGE